MAHKTYTITESGSSNGLSIGSPFTIEITEMYYTENKFVIHAQTKTGAGSVVVNDDIPARIDDLAMPAMNTTKDNDLTSFETNYLDVHYAGNWS